MRKDCSVRAQASTVAICVSIVLGAVPVTVASIPASAGAAMQLLAATGSGGVDGILYRIDPDTAAAVTVGPVELADETGIGITGLAVHPINGVLYAVSSALSNLPGHLFTIDRGSGAAVDVGSLGIANTNCGAPGGIGSVGDISFSAGGTLFGAGPCGASANGNLYTIDLETGAASPVGAVDFAGGGKTGFGLSFLPLRSSAQTLFLVPQGPDANLYEIAPASGAILDTIALSGGASVSVAALTTDPAGKILLGATTNGSSPPTTTRLIAIDPKSGEVTTRGPLPSNVDALALDLLPPVRAPLLGPTSTSPLTLLLVVVLVGILSAARFWRQAA